MAIWNTPESAKLEAQTLGKLSSAPWRLLKTGDALSNAPVALLRPLLDDLVQAESYVEIRGATNQPGEMVCAIRLDTARAALWETNVPVILASLGLDGFGLHRVGDWTLLSRSTVPAPQSTLLSDFRTRIQRDGAPFPVGGTNLWFDTHVDAPGLSDALMLGWKLPATFPQIALEITGDGLNVRTRGEMNFPQPLPESLRPWRVPLHLTAEPMTGLTVMRSVTPLLERLGILTPEQARSFPEQFMVWLRAGPPLQMYFAFPTEDPTNAFWRIAPPLMDWVNSHADSRVYGAITLETNLNELKWNGLSFCVPFLQVGTNAETRYVYGGFGIQPLGNMRLPTELHEHIGKATNVLYFDWDFTASTLPQWRYFDDVTRMVFDAAHASRLRGGRNTIDWILKTTTNFSHSVTELRQSQSNQLVLTRKSTLGLSALELDILLNWIEMPDFPSGMSSLWRTNPAPFRPFRSTNAPSATTP